jgi:hypothetical protein
MDPMAALASYLPSNFSTKPWFPPLLDLPDLPHPNMLANFTNGLSSGMGDLPHDPLPEAQTASQPVVPHNFMPDASHGLQHGLPGHLGNPSTPSHIDLEEDDWLHGRWLDDRL